MNNANAKKEIEVLTRLGYLHKPKPTSNKKSEPMTKREKLALSAYWGMRLRIKNGNVELKKGQCWGILCSESEGKANAQMLINKTHKPISSGAGAISGRGSQDDVKQRRNQRINAFIGIDMDKAKRH